MPWKDAQRYSLVTETFRTVDQTKRNELVKQTETIEYNKGTYVIASFENILDAYSDKLGGFVQNDRSASPLASYRFNTVYLM